MKKSNDPSPIEKPKIFVTPPSQKRGMIPADAIRVDSLENRAVQSPLMYAVITVSERETNVCLTMTSQISR